ncbi:MAG: carbohydrate ABC transporter permease [Spirochaetota bacterium]|nr:carbohydrate ABC transporter permease [Spirochaetota bacterium]
MKPINPAKLLFYFFTFVLAIVVLSPFYFVLANSVKSYSEIILDAAAMPKEVMLSNYQVGIEKVNFWQIFYNSILVTVLGIGGMVLFGSMAAWKLARVRSRVSLFMYSTYILAMIIPFQSIMIPLVVVSSKLHMLHPVGLGVIYWGFGMPLTIFLYRGYFNYVPRELDESGMLDGCSDFTLFWHILFPQLRTMTTTIVILQSLWVWNDFLLPLLILQHDRDYFTIPLGINSFFGVYKAQWDMALPILVLGMIPLIAAFLIAQKHIVRSIAASGLKG